jgi:hypothetical protein
VTLGNFEEPIRISIFVKDLFAGFSMVILHSWLDFQTASHISTQLNLKNDTLRRRFDSLKYDIKKIEEGEYCHISYVLKTIDRGIVSKSFTMYHSENLPPRRELIRYQQHFDLPYGSKFTISVSIDSSGKFGFVHQGLKLLTVM